MHRQGFGAAILLLGALIATPAGAEPAAQVAILDIPFKVTAMRPPGSEVALAVATSGLLSMATRKPASADPKAAPAPDEPAGIAVVWGEEGGAVLSLSDGAVRTTLIGADAVEGLAAAETPRVAVPGSRRAVAGPLSAYFTGPSRATGQAGGLTIRERQSVGGVTAEPKLVPIATATVTPGPDTVFVTRKPRIATLGGKPAILTVTRDAQGASSLTVVAKHEEAWRIAAQSPAQGGGGPDGAPLAVGAIADFKGTGLPQIATIRAPDADGTVQLWSFAEDKLVLLDEARGYSGPQGADEADLAAALPPEKTGPSDLTLPTADRAVLAIVTFRDRARERARVTLPSQAASGIAVLGRGAQARIVVGLADGRVAVVTPPEGSP